MGVEKLGDDAGGFADGKIIVGIELVDLGDGLIHLGDEDDPGEQGVVFKEDAADAVGAEVVPACGESWVDLKGHGRG